ncbi:MAG: hypothetical protein JWO59_2403 [Chloroflexi bacterium]|nr:hypothetical protein [Chloroflexota bacterium]
MINRHLSGGGETCLDRLLKVLTEIIDANEASKRAALRVGYRECGRLRRHLFREGTWWDVWLGEVLRDEWEAMQRAT